MDTPATPPSAPDPTLWAPARYAPQVIDGVGEGIVVFDRDLRYRVWNRFMEQYTGISAAALIGRAAYEATPNIIDEGVVILLRRALAGERVEQHEARF